MFWRNNYSNDETIKEYFNSGDRTIYTYTESRSYRKKPLVINVQEPKIMRPAIHSHEIESNETNVNTDNTMKSKTNSALSTPRQKNRITLPNSKRVLRSKNSIGSNENDNFIIELDDVSRHNYRIGALNTNTNNSGPEEIEHQWNTKPDSRDYHLSADEDHESDTATTSIDKEATFGTNNANIKKFQNKVSNRWFQKNMYGLPNDESDDVHPEFNGAISGDEQYDIASFQNSNAFQTSKLTKSKLKKSSKSNNQKKDSLICSPVALLSYLFEFIWLCALYISRVIGQCMKHLTTYSNSPRTYLTPLYLPGAVINSVIYWLAYSIDRLFGTTVFRRWFSFKNYSRRSAFARFVLNTLWLLFWVGVAFIGLHCLLGSNELTESAANTSSVFSTVTESVYGIVGKECMEADECCTNKVSLGKRFAYCLLSWPARCLSSIVKSDAQQSIVEETPQQIITSNISDIEHYFNTLLGRIRILEDLQRKYNLRMTGLEKDSKERDIFHSIQNEKLSELTNEMKTVTTKLQLLQTDLDKFDSIKIAVENSLKNMTVTQKEDIRTVSMDIDKLRKKMEQDISEMKALLAKSDQSETNSQQASANIDSLLAKVQENIRQITDRFIKLESRTAVLETAEETSKTTVSALKKEILDEINHEFSLYKENQIKIIEKISEQLSKLEENLDENNSKLLNRDDLLILIESHLSTVESNIKTEVNSTLWNNVKEHIRTMIESSLMGVSKGEVKTPIFVENVAAKSCCNPSFICRREASCARISNVRQMIADALKLYSADRIGLADFALESAGGTIATTRCTETYTDRAATLTIFGIPLLRLTNSPRTIIQPNINPGECWAMKGNKGSVVVQLSSRVKVTAVSIDHIPKSLSPSGSIDSAIKEFEIKALDEEADSVGKSLGNFTYKMDSLAVQTFYVEKPVETNFVEMLVKSNYGNVEYTCIYRLRVHGDLIRNK